MRGGAHLYDPLVMRPSRTRPSRGPVRAASPSPSVLVRLTPIAVGAVLATGAAAHATPATAPEPSAATSFDLARSVRVMRRGEPIFAAPAKDAKRRGTVARDILLPLYERVEGTGCAGSWLRVDPAGWVCSEVVEPSLAPPIPPGIPALAPTANGLPFEYFFVGPDGASGYHHLAGLDTGDPDVALDAGFSVAVVERRLRDGDELARTHGGLWVPARDLFPARPATLRGETLGEADQALAFGWVLTDTAPVHASPSAFAKKIGERPRWTRVPILERLPRERFVKVGEGEFMEAKRVRQPTRAAPPAEVDVGAGERWLDVELATQTLVAYEGERAVFATLVSTGRGRDGAPNATPKGVHRIWVKLFVSHMDNLEDEEAGRYYRMEDVPWVQYFSKGIGLHGTYWHRAFGEVHSHGCVNLSPLDAETLFHFTAPHLPSGWTAALPSPYERGTIVRVR